jgi:dTDP-glucose pyrophosphorylase
MRAADPDTPLTADQRRAADAGLKPMIPINGRPFLDYVLSVLADAGIRDVALVVAPDHDAVSRYYTVDAPPSRLRLSFVTQTNPLGTADAVLAAHDWVGDDPFLVLNADNLYPERGLADLAALDGPGLLAFDRDDLVSSSNIPAERIQSFALIDVDHAGHLREIVEKPADRPADAQDLPADRLRQGYGGPPKLHAKAEAGSHTRDGRKTDLLRKTNLLISMNCWRFDARIFAACRDVPPSPRGELELPEAVGLAVRRGITFTAVPARGPVLDLSRRSDTADVGRRLAGVVPRP